LLKSTQLALILTSKADHLFDAFGISCTWFKVTDDKLQSTSNNKQDR